MRSPKGKSFITIVFLGISSLNVIGFIFLFVVLLMIPSWLYVYAIETTFYLREFTNSSPAILGWILLYPLTFIGTLYFIGFIKHFREKTLREISGHQKRHTSICSVLVIIVMLTFPDVQYDLSKYKQFHRNQITIIAKGHPEIALIFSNEYIRANPEDMEAYFIKAICHAQLGEYEYAMEAMKTAIDLGLPFERFLAGPRNLLSPLYKYSEFKKFKDKEDIELIHGPVLGCVTPYNASFWVRTVHEIPIAIKYANNSDLLNSVISVDVSTKSNKDYTAVITIGGLEPNTTYYYDLVIKGEEQDLDPLPSFTTFVELENPSEFEIGFGGGAGYNPENEYMWKTIKKRNLDAFLLLGDNVYIDTPEVSETQRYCYYRRQSREEYRKFSASTPIYAIWDDHDFGQNDQISTTDLDDPSWKLDVLEVFKENWVNPYYGGGSDDPGVYFNFSIGDVDFFMLDCRFYREDPNKEDPTMLGSVQKEWLFDHLKKSTATFRVIASSVPFTPEARPEHPDSWEGFTEEREEIFSFIEEKKITGVVLIAADRHRSDAYKIKREDGYDLYEFQSSKLTNFDTHPLMSGSLFGYNDKCSFGKLSFDMTKADPQVKFTIVNIDNKNIESMTIKLSDLSF